MFKKIINVIVSGYEKFIKRKKKSNLAVVNKNNINNTQQEDDNSKNNFYIIEVEEEENTPEENPNDNITDTVPTTIADEHFNIELSESEIKESESIANEIKHNLMLDEFNKYIKNEFNAWGLKQEYLGCKFILRIGEKASKLNTDMNSSEIAKILAEGTEYAPLTVLSSISFIRRKANYSNSQLFTILNTLDSDTITNKIFIDIFIRYYKSLLHV